MIPGNVDSSQGLYVIGTIILVIGIAAAVAGLLIKRRLEEEHRDERYVRERRGEEVVATEPPRYVGLLQYSGYALGAIGVIVLIIAWTVTPGNP